MKLIWAEFSKLSCSVLTFHGILFSSGSFTVSITEVGAPYGLTFTNPDYSNLNNVSTPTMVYSPVTYTEQVVVSMKNKTKENAGSTDFMWTSGSAEEFVSVEPGVGAASTGNEILIVTQGSRAQSQKADHGLHSMAFKFGMFLKSY